MANHFTVCWRRRLLPPLHSDYALLPQCVFVVAKSLFMVLLIVNGIFLLYNSINGNYVSVAGVCENIEFTGIRKRVKRITLKLEENSLKISVRHKIKRLKIGDTVIVYLSVKAPVYPQDDGYVVFNYYAMEVRNGV